MGPTEKIDLSSIERAQKVFERFRQDMEDDRDQAGAAQSFEFCVELAWKMLKRVLFARGLETGSPKDTFRKAAEEKLIKDPEIWFNFQKLRNFSSHAYSQEHLDEIVSVFDAFSIELEKLMKVLRANTHVSD